MFHKILVVCLGNICRSPVGEGLFKNHFDKMGRSEIEVSSAGITAMVNDPASEHSVTVMRERNIDISDHVARQLTHEMMVQNDLILVMELDQKKHLEQAFTFARGKIHLIGRFQDKNKKQEVADPYLQPISAFELMAEQMESCVNDWMTYFSQCFSAEKKLKN